MQLHVEPREVKKKEAKRLRKNAFVPCIIYGSHLDASIPVAVSKPDLLKAYRKAGRSTAIELKWDNVDELVLVENLQLDPVSDHIMHVDFLAVKRDEKVTADVPVVLIGESPYEKSGEWSVQLLTNRVEVEALPMDLPHDLQFDISWIEEAWEVFFVKDLEISDKVEILTDGEQALVNSAQFVEEVEEEPVDELLVWEDGEELPEGEEAWDAWEDWEGEDNE